VEPKEEKTTERGREFQYNPKEVTIVITPISDARVSRIN